MRNHPTDARGLVVPDGSWPSGREADGALERLRRFVNTQNLESGGDVIATTEELADWLAREGWPWSGGEPSHDELEQVHRLRSVLRRLAVANRDGVRDEDAESEMNELLRGFMVEVEVFPPRLIACDRRFGAFAVALADAVAGAVRNGTWSRLKACTHCRWVVFDRSKNRSVRWCSEQACSTRSRSADYRRRHAAPQPPERGPR